MMRTAEEQEQEQLDFEQAIQASLTSNRIQQKYNNDLATAIQASKQESKQLATAIQASLTSHRIQQNNNLVTANQAKKQKTNQDVTIFSVLHVCSNNNPSNDAKCIVRVMHQYGLVGDYKVQNISVEQLLTLPTNSRIGQYDLVLMNCVQKFNNPEEVLRALCYALKFKGTLLFNAKVNSTPLFLAYFQILLPAIKCDAQSSYRLNNFESLLESTTQKYVVKVNSNAVNNPKQGYSDTYTFPAMSPPLQYYVPVDSNSGGGDCLFDSIWYLLPQEIKNNINRINKTREETEASRHNKQMYKPKPSWPLKEYLATMLSFKAAFNIILKDLTAVFDVFEDEPPYQGFIAEWESLTNDYYQGRVVSMSYFADKPNLVAFINDFIANKKVMIESGTVWGDEFVMKFASQTLKINLVVLNEEKQKPSTLRILMPIEETFPILVILHRHAHFEPLVTVTSNQRTIRVAHVGYTWQ